MLKTYLFKSKGRAKRKGNSVSFQLTQPIFADDLGLSLQALDVRSWVYISLYLPVRFLLALKSLATPHRRYSSHN